MAGSLSVDDKLMGEKMHYYCSSSEDESEEGKEITNAKSSQAAGQPGLSTNTGPKGVIADWRRFKQLETEKREEQERELVDLQKKLSLTCRSNLDDDKEKDADEELWKELECLDNDFLREYQQKRLEEMRKLLRDVPQYNSVTDLATANEFLEATENNHPMTTVIIHVYEQNSAPSTAMNGCIQTLSKDHPTVKFCRILAHRAQLSSKFSEEGVPALLVYKKGELVGNLVALGDTLGEDFFAEDVESLLNMHGLLPPRTMPEQVLAMS